MRPVEKFLAESPVFEDVGSGYLEGYASIFNVLDQQNEVVLPGAFKRTIKERIAAGKVFLMNKHMGDGGGTLEAVGVISAAKEDGKGLWIHADFFDTPEAQQTRRQNMVAKFGLSIGGQAIIEPKKIDGQIVMALKEIKLSEVTVTPFPACDEARVTVVKSLSPENGTPENADDPPQALPFTAPVCMAPDVALIVVKTLAWQASIEMEITMKELSQ